MTALENGSFAAVLTRQDDLCLVRVRGELGLDNAATFGKRLTRLLDRTVVVDLAQLSFIDSSGFAAFVKAKNRAEKIGHALVVTRPRPNIERLFAMVGLKALIGPWRSEWDQAPRSPQQLHPAESVDA